MAHTNRLISLPIRIEWDSALIRFATLAVGLIIWETTARSGLLYRDVVPSVGAILDGFGRVLANPDLLGHASTTLFELAVALAIGGSLGVIFGLGIGASRLAGRVLEPPIYYLGPMPKIIFLPLLIMGFGIGSGSKIALGTMSAFFPVVLSVAAGIRQIDTTYLKVGRSFRMNASQIVTKIYLPALRAGLVNAFRLAFGVCLIGVLLAETKFARAGLGYLITQYFQRFDMPSLYAIALIIFGFAIVVNWLIGKCEASMKH